MTWAYVINLEEDGCRGCGRHLREGVRVFQRTNPITDEKATLCSLCMAEYVIRKIQQLEIENVKKEFMAMREG